MAGMENTDFNDYSIFNLDNIRNEPNQETPGVILHDELTDADGRGAPSLIRIQDSQPGVALSDLGMSYEEQENLRTITESLEDDVRKLRESRSEKIRLINKKIERYNKKTLGEDAASVAIVDRTPILDNSEVKWL